MYQKKGHFNGSSKLAIFHSCRFQRRRKKLHSHYRKVTQGTLTNPEFFCKFISPSFFEPASAALSLLEMVVIVPDWAMIQLEAFMTPLFAMILAIYRTIKSEHLSEWLGDLFCDEVLSFSSRLLEEIL